MASLFESCILPFIILMVFELQIPVISAEPQVPCYFVFGDSLVDNGNNNNLVTQAKVNYPPYGIDFPGQNATGRFTNGENSADIIGRLLGFANYTPPYATARGPDILQGVNYGSGGSGIRDETGRNLGDRVTFNEQLLRHGITKLRISVFQRNISFTKEYLRKCIYTVGMGNNDYLNNYLMPDKYSTSRIYTPERYADVLIQQYSKQLKALYNYEARKVAVFGLGLIGCAPAVVSKFGANASGCVDRVNAAVALFNEKLKPLVDDFNSNLTGAKFIYINTTNINLGDPIAAGFSVFTPCCIASVDFGKGQCEPNLPPCSDRDIYIFWDEFHPTQRSNNITATRSYMAASPFDSYPMDIRSLAQQ
ncbi:GDSL-like Lipase/Acylhydrolase superfamily protein [Heracleum sosnowskyi]|uniref:GDSL-like Lipase/Acylhydrolase superfamily protein n=1 Tax=Heracleum sosnowskyi TaxID=360622 RepID=A0AAD8IBL9_9APIA|nr:GDSL-like Lipase/Acylhydrolase superfamily protein [Heracleum sosnowskyi]